MVNQAIEKERFKAAEDLIPHITSDDKRFDALEVLSIAPTIAEALDAVFEDTSVSEIFRGDNV